MVMVEDLEPPKENFVKLRMINSGLWGHRISHGCKTMLSEKVNLLAPG